MRVADEASDARWLVVAIAVRLVFNAVSVGLVTLLRPDGELALWLFVTAFIGMTGILDFGFTPFAIRTLRSGAASVGSVRADVGRLTRRYAPVGVVGSGLLIAAAVWSGLPLLVGPQTGLTLAIGVVLIPLTVCNRVGDAVARGVDRVGESARVEVETYGVLTVVLAVAIPVGAPIWVAVAAYAAAILVSARRRWSIATSVSGAGAPGVDEPSTDGDRETYTPAAAARWAVVTMSTQVVIGGATIVAPRLLDLADVAAVLLLLRIVVIVADVSSAPLQAALPRVARETRETSADTHVRVVRAVLGRFALGGALLLGAVAVAPASVIDSEGSTVTTVLLVAAWFVNRRNYASSLLHLVGAGRSPWVAYGSGLLAYVAALCALVLVQPVSARNAWWIAGAHLGVEAGLWLALRFVDATGPRTRRQVVTAGGDPWG